MHAIAFNQPGWPNDAANDIVQVIAYNVGGQTRYRITVGNNQYIDDLDANDPLVLLANHIHGILPNELQQVATQRHNYGQGPAYHMNPAPPPPAPGIP
jgi:hypothetical protein